MHSNMQMQDTEILLNIRFPFILCFSARFIYIIQLLKPLINIKVFHHRHILFASFTCCLRLPFITFIFMLTTHHRREKQKKKLEKNTKSLSKGLKQIGFEINSESQIIPIIIGSEKSAMDFGKFLFDNGVFTQPIRYPTVPKNQARLRISVTAWLQDKDIDRALEIFEKAYVKFC